MNHRTVLLVDDNEATLKLIRLLLTNEGVAVRVAMTAEEALETLSAGAPDAILTDIQLPGITGLELIRRIRADAKIKDALILCISANAMAENIEEAYTAGCDAYLTKPIDTRTFAGSVRRHLEGEPMPGRARMARGR
jgi:two-component system cell cycle response regulator DivK